MGRSVTVALRYGFQVVAFSVCSTFVSIPFTSAHSM
jgi:hypothetical protein